MKITKIKVNIGCGPHVVADWINYDSSPHLILSRHQNLKKLLYSLRVITKQTYETSFPYKIIRRINLLKGIPLDDETVDFIYCSHFVEHLTHKDVIKLLKDCYRILMPGGWIRVICPDLRIITSKYLEGNTEYVLFKSKKSDLSHAFIKSLLLSANRSFLERIFFSSNLHCCMYDYNSLSSLLSKCGFACIEKRQYKEGITPDINQLDSRPEESLFVEAQKL